MDGPATSCALIGVLTAGSGFSGVETRLCVCSCEVCHASLLCCPPAAVLCWSQSLREELAMRVQEEARGDSNLACGSISWSAPVWLHDGRHGDTGVCV